jgi:hypothetical protein
MSSLSVYYLPLLLVTAFSLLAWAISDFVRLLIQQHFSPLRSLRGPPSVSFFTGNLNEMHDQENNDLVENWEAQYGPTFVYKGFIGGCRLMTTDLVAVAHIFGHAYDYPKPDFIRDSLAQMAAGHGGLLTVEGDVHKKQVCVLLHSPRVLEYSLILIQRRILVSRFPSWFLSYVSFPAFFRFESLYTPLVSCWNSTTLVSSWNRRESCFDSSNVV